MYPTWREFLSSCVQSKSQVQTPLGSQSMLLFLLTGLANLCCNLPWKEKPELLKAGKKWVQLSNWVRKKKLKCWEMLFLNEGLNVWETGNCWIPFFLQAQLCYPCLWAPLWKSVSEKTGLVDWILQVLPWDKVSTDVNEHWGQKMVPIPKETMLGAAVVDRVWLGFCPRETVCWM